MALVFQLIGRYSSPFLSAMYLRSHRIPTFPAKVKLNARDVRTVLSRWILSTFVINVFFNDILHDQFITIYSVDAVVGIRDSNSPITDILIYFHDTTA